MILEMTYRPSNTNGYCKIVIDGKIIIEKSGIYNILEKITICRAKDWDLQR